MDEAILFLLTMSHHHLLLWYQGEEPTFILDLFQVSSNVHCVESLLPFYILFSVPLIYHEDDNDNSSVWSCLGLCFPYEHTNWKKVGKKLFLKNTPLPKQTPISAWSSFKNNYKKNMEHMGYIWGNLILLKSQLNQNMRRLKQTSVVQCCSERVQGRLATLRPD